MSSNTVVTPISLDSWEILFCTSVLTGCTRSVFTGSWAEYCLVGRWAFTKESASSFVSPNCCRFWESLLSVTLFATPAAPLIAPPAIPPTMKDCKVSLPMSSHALRSACWWLMPWFMYCCTAWFLADFVPEISSS